MANAPIRLWSLIPPTVLALDLIAGGVQNAKRRPARGGAVGNSAAWGRAKRPTFASVLALFAHLRREGKRGVPFMDYKIASVLPGFGGARI